MYANLYKSFLIEEVCETFARDGVINLYSVMFSY